MQTFCQVFAVSATFPSPFAAPYVVNFAGFEAHHSIRS